MNTDPPGAPRDELEQNLTAFLLGELSPDEAAKVQAALSRDADLKCLCEHLRGAIPLVREALARPSEPMSTPTDLPHFEPGRREQLLEKLRQSGTLPMAPKDAGPRVIPVALPEATVERVRSSAWLALAACLVALLAGASLALNWDRVAPGRGEEHRLVLGSSFAKAWPEESRTAGGSAPVAEDASTVTLDPFSTPKVPPITERQSLPAAPVSAMQPQMRSRYGLSPPNRLSANAVEPDGSAQAGAPAGESAPSPSVAGTPSLNYLERPKAIEDEMLTPLQRDATSPSSVNGPVAGTFLFDAPKEEGSGQTTGNVAFRSLGRGINDLADSMGLATDTREQSDATGAAWGDYDSDGPLALMTRKQTGGRPQGEPAQASAESFVGEALREGVEGVSASERTEAGKDVMLRFERGGQEDLPNLLSRSPRPSLSETTNALRNLSESALPIPQPEVITAENAFSTFSLNVSDVSFKLADASLVNGLLPAPATVRGEEFLNAFDYRDPEASPGMPLAFVWERARYPFAHNRDILRLALRTAARGREPGRALNLVLALDRSGSMERADRVRIVREALRTLATQLQPMDRVSVIGFARTPRLWVDGLSGDRAGELIEVVGNLTPEGGTHLEGALQVAYETARKHFIPGGGNRVVLLTDGAANLGEVRPDALKRMVESERARGIALDCFGIGWEGYNDTLLETLARNGDGRYGFVNSAEEAGAEFAGKLAGALQVAAADVKVQVEFNPGRVSAFRQVGYANHQLSQEQFRDNTVDAAEIGAAESGNAIYLVEMNPGGEGPLGWVRVRYRVPATGITDEHEWMLPHTGPAARVEQSSPALRLATTTAAFSEWLVSSPHAADVTTDRLLALISGVPEVYAPDPRPARLEAMIRQAGAISGR